MDLRLPFYGDNHLPPPIIFTIAVNISLKTLKLLTHAQALYKEDNFTLIKQARHL